MHKKQMHFLYLSILTSISYFRTHQRVQGRGDALLVSLWQFHVPLFVTQIRSICPYLLSLWQPFFLERNEFPFWLDLEIETIDILVLIMMMSRLAIKFEHIYEMYSLKNLISAFLFLYVEVHINIYSPSHNTDQWINNEGNIVFEN